MCNIRGAFQGWVNPNVKLFDKTLGLLYNYVTQLYKRIK